MPGSLFVARRARVQGLEKLRELADEIEGLVAESAMARALCESMLARPPALAAAPRRNR